MFTFLVAIISVLALVLCVIILIQSGKGGGLAASFGGASSSTDSFMGGRQTATVLTRLTWIGGGLFLFLALVLAVLSSRPTGAPESILRQGVPSAGETALPEPPPSLLETEGATPGDTGAAPGGASPEGGGARDTSGAGGA